MNKVREEMHKESLLKKEAKEAYINSHIMALETKGLQKRRFCNIIYNYYIMY